MASIRKGKSRRTKRTSFLRGAFFLTGAIVVGASYYASLEQREYNWRDGSNPAAADLGYKLKLRRVSTDFGSMTLHQKEGCGSHRECFGLVAHYDTPFAHDEERRADFRIPTNAEIQANFGDILGGKRPNIYGDSPYRGVHGLVRYRLEAFRHTHLQELGYHYMQAERNGAEVGRRVFSDDTHRHVRRITQEYAGKAYMLTCDYTPDTRNWFNRTLRSIFGYGHGFSYYNESKYWFERDVDGIKAPDQKDVGRAALRAASRTPYIDQLYPYLEHPLLPPDRTRPNLGGVRPLPAAVCPELWSFYTRTI
jgi:hypothetical protein